MGALVAARSEPERAATSRDARALAAEPAAARRELPDMRERVESLRAQNARLVADWHAAICQAIDGRLAHVSTADSSTRSRPGAA